MDKYKMYNQIVIFNDSVSNCGKSTLYLQYIKNNVFSCIYNNQIFLLSSILCLIPFCTQTSYNAVECAAGHSWRSDVAEHSLFDLASVW